MALDAEENPIKSSTIIAFLIVSPFLVENMLLKAAIFLSKLNNTN